MLAEYGIVLPQHPGQVRSGLPAVLEDAESQLTGFGRELFQSLYEELAQLDEKITDADGRIQLAFQNTPDCQRIAAVEGVGPLIATAIVAAISNGHAFENGRQFSAWLGLVPRQNSSGGKNRLLGISKRGDPYLENPADSWSATGGLSSKSQDRQAKPLDQRQTATARNIQGLRSGGQQERTHHLVADRSRTGIPARSIATRPRSRNKLSQRDAEPPTMAQLVRPASSEPDGGRAIQGR